MERKRINFTGVCTCDGANVKDTGRRMPVTYNYETMSDKDIKHRGRCLDRQIQDKQKRLGIVVEEQATPITYIYFTRIWDKVKELSIEQAKSYVDKGYKVFALDSNGISYSVDFKGLELILNKED